MTNEDDLKISADELDLAPPQDLAGALPAQPVDNNDVVAEIMRQMKALEAGLDRLKSVVDETVVSRGLPPGDQMDERALPPGPQLGPAPGQAAPDNPFDRPLVPEGAHDPSVDPMTPQAAAVPVDPFAQPQSAPAADPFATAGSAPVAPAPADPFAQTEVAPAADPFATAGSAPVAPAPADPFAQTEAAPAADPFATAGSAPVAPAPADPFAQTEAAPAADPFATAGSAPLSAPADPFATAGSAPVTGGVVFEENGDGVISHFPDEPVPADDYRPHVSSQPLYEPPVDPFATAGSAPVVEPQQVAVADPYAAPDMGVSQPVADPYIHNQPVASQPQAQGQPTVLVTDILVAVAEQGGKQGAEMMAHQASISKLRESSKEARERQRSSRTTTKKRKRTEPVFLEMGTRFHPEHPLVIAVTSPKGGVGKSTTSANIAAFMAKSAEASGRNDVRVLLIDGDIANGNLALRLAKRPRPNLIDLVKHMDKMSQARQPLDSYERDMGPFVFVPESTPNLDILAAPDHPHFIEQLQQEDLQNLMALFSRYYQIIVIDSGTQIIELPNQAWLHFGSQVYAMVEPEIACLNITREYIHRARKLHLMTADKTRVVCIRADMPFEDIDPKKLIAEVFSFVPPDKTFFVGDFHRDAMESSNAGEFLVLDSGEYADAMRPIIKSSLETYEQAIGG